MAAARTLILGHFQRLLNLQSQIILIISHYDDTNCHYLSLSVFLVKGTSQIVDVDTGRVTLVTPAQPCQEKA